jgi:hypothetical protein
MRERRAELEVDSPTVAQRNCQRALIELVPPLLSNLVARRCVPNERKLGITKVWHHHHRVQNSTAITRMPTLHQLRRVWLRLQFAPPLSQPRLSDSVRLKRIQEI